MKKLVFLIVALIFILGCTQQTVTEPKPTVEEQPIVEVIEEATDEEEIMEEPEKEIETKAEVVKPKTEEPKEVVKEFKITAEQWNFNPGKITANKGDKVKITATSIDVTHGFSLPDFGINERLEPGRPVKIEFVADKAGTFTFRCNVPCGSGHSNMKGTLIVE